MLILISRVSHHSQTGCLQSNSRFLESVSQSDQAPCLGAHAAFIYLVNKCLSSGLAEEDSNSQPIRQSLVEYSEACREASSFLHKAFKVRDLLSRSIQGVEGFARAKTSGSLDEFKKNFFRMNREADLLEVQMTEDNKIRLFFKGLVFSRSRVLVI